MHVDLCVCIGHIVRDIYLLIKIAYLKARFYFFHSQFPAVETAGYHCYSPTGQDEELISGAKIRTFHEKCSRKMLFLVIFTYLII
jgi:hypothetical protein